MEAQFDTVVEGYHFRVTRIKDGYRVYWLDCPDETYPSGFSSWAHGCPGCAEPVFDDELIIAHIKHWLNMELEDHR